MVKKQHQEICPVCVRPIKADKWTEFRKVEGVPICEACWRMPWGKLLQSCAAMSRTIKVAAKQYAAALDNALRIFSKVAWASSYPIVFPPSKAAPEKKKGVRFDKAPTKRSIKRNTGAKAKCISASPAKKSKRKFSKR